ncbi:MFS general substrate transporter [Microthyrium microscopicum]|uniref:MFS general substrate transporter n=1 Tax=Microthyrium microscopicum TaxID=703497 RepID=A0A6A6TV62_9PEZI|nr:MFS general substrate transporter [Microthyrium microscopicum]
MLTAMDDNKHQVVDDVINTTYQSGVQDIEAITISWSKTSLVCAYVLITLIYLVQALVSGVSGALIPYVTSAFAEHSLTPTTGILSAVIGGVTNLSIAKVLDIFGRPHGFLVCVVSATIGLIMSAACNNVKAYAASQIFYTVGINGIGYSLSVFVADTTSLRHRALMQGLVNIPWVVIPWAAGPIAAKFLTGAGWRWAFGMESILIPVVTLPLFGLFMYQFNAAKRQGIIPKRESGRTPSESLLYYIHEFDVVGLFLLSAGVAFTTLPFNLYTFQAKGFGSPLIIGFLVVGVILLLGFGIWERFFAKVSFLPWRILKDRTAFGSCIVSFTLFLSYSCWGLYFTSVLQVVNDLDVAHATYVSQIYPVASIFFAIMTGAIISYTSRYKAVTLYLGLPMAVLGLGIMIKYHDPDQAIGYIVMCQIFLAVSGGVIMVGPEIAIMAAAADHQYFAVSIAVLGMSGSIGSAVGLTISAAIWQATLPTKLALYLPPDDLPNLAMIYEDIVTQLSFPVGSPTRLAIQHAYGDAQKNMMITATAVWVVGFASVIIWRDINVAGIKQTKGYVV